MIIIILFHVRLKPVTIIAAIISLTHPPSLIYIYIYIYTCVYAYIYIYIYTYTPIQIGGLRGSAA